MKLPLKKVILDFLFYFAYDAIGLKKSNRLRASGFHWKPYGFLKTECGKLRRKAKCVLLAHKCSGL